MWRFTQESKKVSDRHKFCPTQHASRAVRTRQHAAEAAQDESGLLVSMRRTRSTKSFRVVPVANLRPSNGEFRFRWQSGMTDRVPGRLLDDPICPRTRGHIPSLHLSRTRAERIIR